MYSAPAEEEWCEQEASISRPRGVHRPQGQLRERERETNKSTFFIDAKCAPTGSNKPICIVGGSDGVQVSVRTAHPIFLRLNIQLIADPGQRMDGFGQYWTVQTHPPTHAQDNY